MLLMDGLSCILRSCLGCLGLSKQIQTDQENERDVGLARCGSCLKRIY